jgi:UDP-N-acetylmuramoyl-tripeptide--D-alanyl-D-alanine ligase
MLTVSAPTVATQASFNNELGLPITLLQCTPETKYCILEMGARHKGDISALCEIANPSIGVVLKVGSAHVGEFGSVENIAETKGELIESLGKDGVAILGTYDSFTPAMAAKHPGKIITFGEIESADVRAADVEIREGRPHFDLVTPAGRDAVGMRLVGAHQISNALAAAAVGTALNIPIESITSALSTAELKSKWRMEIHELPDFLLINDAYNANPESMAAALRSLSLFAQERGGESWAFLGAMHELGTKGNEEHRKLGLLAQELGIDHLVCVNAPSYGEAIQGNSQMALHYCASRQEAAALTAQISQGDVALVKASRSEGLELLAEEIEELWRKSRSEE